MAKGLNLKATFGADTQPIKQGAKEAAASIKEFEGKAGDAMDSFAGLFGTSISQISASVKAFQGGILMMNRGMQTSATTSTVFSKALGILKIALISTGIGAIVVALGALVAYFKRSQDGADALSRAMAPFKVLFDNLVDVFAALGRAMVKAFKDPKEALKDLWEAIKTNLINRFTGLVDSFAGLGKVIRAAFSFDWDGVKEGAKEVGSAMLQFTTGLDKQQRESIAKWMGTTAEAISKRMAESQKLADRQAAYEKRRIAFIKEESVLNANIAKFREQASDTESYTAEERLAASKKAEEQLRILYSKKIALAREAYEIAQGQDDLAENMNSDTEKTNEAWAEINNLTAEQAEMLRSMNKEQKKLTSQVEKEKAAREEMVSLRAKVIAEVDSSDVDNKVNKVVTAANKPISAIKLRAIIDPAYQENFEKFRADLETAQEFSKAVAAQVSQAFNDIAVGIGETLGQLLAGETGWKSFGVMIATVFADMAISVGKIAIATGIATLGIKKSLESLNPYVAIAGGIALVALGTWAKSSLKGIASGGGGSTFSGNNYSVPSGIGAGSSGRSSYAGSFGDKSKQEIVIRGELVARGGTLTAVIDRERQARKIRT